MIPNQAYLILPLVFGIFGYFINKWLSNQASIGVKDLTNSGVIRWNSLTRPSVGGISFFLCFLIGFIGVLITNTEELFANYQIVGLFSATTLAFLIGLADDVYTINPFLKFVGQFACANILYFCGVYIEISSVIELNYVFSLLWVVGVMNSINMLDNMDGITGVTSLGILVMSIGVMLLSGAFSPALMVLMLVITGALVGFLKLNWNPAKVYMGDSGSQFLGAFLAGIAMMFLWNIYDASENQLFRWSQLALPLVVFVLPIIDSITVSIRRVLRGQSPFVGGRDHTTHNLAIWGLKDAQVAMLFTFISVISLTFVFWMSHYIVSQPIICALLAFMYFLMLFWGVQMIYQNNAKKNTAKLSKQTAKVKPLVPKVNKNIRRKQKAALK